MYLPFAKALPGLKKVPGEMGSEWLVLPKDVHWPGRASIREPIMIRPCYKTAMDKCNEVFGFESSSAASAASAATVAAASAATVAAASATPSLAQATPQSNSSGTCTRKEQYAITFTGESGIGKSSMGFVYMWCLAQRGKRFILECVVSNRVRLLFNYTGDGKPILQAGSKDAFQGEWK
jgi:hypothetical protein